MTTAGFWRSWALTDAGAVRKANEDNYIARPEIGLWMVADGAGGHQHGEVASQMLGDALAAIAGGAASDMVSDVRAAVARTHQALRDRADAEAAQSGHPVTIASTIVVMLARNAHYACLWAGDSRIYHWRGGRLTQITRDHSLVQELVESGAIQPHEAERHPHANVVTRAIGAEGSNPALDKVTDRAEPGDRFLLCSDGVTKCLDDHAIGQLIGGAGDPARRLIEATLAERARDNVTAIVVEYGPPDIDATLLRR